MKRLLAICRKYYGIIAFSSILIPQIVLAQEEASTGGFLGGIEAVFQEIVDVLNLFSTLKLVAKMECH